MVNYTIQTNPRSRSMRLKITPKGEVVVVVPIRFPKIMIDPFVRKHHDWIETHLQKVQAKKSTALGESDESVFVFGKEYQKKIAFSATRKIGVHILGEQILINPVTDSQTSIQKSMESFLKMTAEKYILPRTHQLGKLMGISFANITLRAQKTRWGSCSSSGNLNFNWRLVHCPPAVIDYVIIHELAHRKEMNHSERFWRIVRQYDPEYLKHRGWLNRHGMNLE